MDVSHRTNRLNSDTAVKKKKISLLRKLRTIKLNRSRENNSFYDIKSYYENKLRKLRVNNDSLAKAHAQQRQISQSWYQEFVTAKADVQDRDEKLLRYKIIDNKNFDEAVQTEALIQMELISEPLIAAVKISIDNVVTLVENLTHIKSLVSSMTTNRKESYKKYNGANCNNTTRRSLKSPKKNVVHPMVKGHLIQPTIINLPRISLEDQRKYRLRAREQNNDNLDLSSINEHSSNESNELLNLSTNSDVVSPVLNMENSSSGNLSIGSNTLVDPLEYETVSEDLSIVTARHDCDSSLNEESFTSTVQISSPIEESFTQTIQISSPIENSRLDLSTKENNKISPNKAKRSSNNQNQKVTKTGEDDPLEGPSWFHTKKRRTSKKKRCISSLRSMNSVRLVLEKFSDDDDEDEETSETRLKSTFIRTPKSPLCLTSPPSNELPSFSLDSCEQEMSRVSRRTKSRNKTSKKNSGSKLWQLDSFTNISTPESYQIKKSKVIIKHCNTSLDAIDQERSLANATCLVNKSMDVTQCESNTVFDLLHDEQETPGNNIINNVEDQVIDEDSRMKSISPCVLREEKENMSPNANFGHLKKFSIIIQDCMKNSLNIENVSYCDFPNENSSDVKVKMITLKRIKGTCTNESQIVTRTKKRNIINLEASDQDEKLNLQKKSKPKKKITLKNKIEIPKNCVQNSRSNESKVLRNRKVTKIIESNIFSSPDVSLLEFEGFTPKHCYINAESTKKIAAYESFILQPHISDNSDPLVFDPLGSDPLASDPLASDPLASDPLASEPLASEPLASEPLAFEPLAFEPLAFEPLAFEPLAFDPQAFDPQDSDPLTLDVYLLEPSVLERPDPLIVPQQETENMKPSETMIVVDPYVINQKEINSKEFDPLALDMHNIVNPETDLENPKESSEVPVLVQDPLPRKRRAAFAQPGSLKEKSLMGKMRQSPRKKKK